MSPYKPLFVDLSFDYVSFPFPETLAAALIPHRVALQTDHQRRTFCCRKGNVVQHVLISGLTFGAWSTSLLDSLSLLTLSRWAAATRSEQTSSRFCPSWSSTSPTYATATCTIATRATMRLVVSGIRTLLPRPSLGRICQSCCKRYRRSCDSWACECSHCRFMRGSSALRSVLFFHSLHVCLQGAGWVNKAAGGQRVQWGKKRAAEGAGEVAAENGAERRADPQAAQTQKTGKDLTQSLHTIMQKHNLILRVSFFPLYASPSWAS